ncbi:hypothetical protein [Salinigranum sp. GCM10025319]|uniref:hypothetical protein n=1 Tax=Salinigranum sp. GCM10025319 TaxID=3252687 RepID=UPI0036230590
MQTRYNRGRDGEGTDGGERADADRAGVARRTTGPSTPNARSDGTERAWRGATSRRRFVRGLAALPFLGSGVRPRPFASTASGSTGTVEQLVPRDLQEHVGVSVATGHLLSTLYDAFEGDTDARWRGAAFVGTGARVVTPSGSAEETVFDSLSEGSRSQLWADTGRVTVDGSGTVAHAGHWLFPDRYRPLARDPEEGKIVPSLGGLVPARIRDLYTGERIVSPMLHAEARRPPRGVSVAAAVAFHGVQGQIWRVVTKRGVPQRGQGGSPDDETVIEERPPAGADGDAGEKPPERQVIDGDRTGSVGFGVAEFQDDAFEITENADGTVTVRLRLDRLDLYGESLSRPRLYYLPNDDPNPPPITPIPVGDGDDGSSDGEFGLEIERRNDRLPESYRIDIVTDPDTTPPDGDGGDANGDDSGVDIEVTSIEGSEPPSYRIRVVTSGDGEDDEVYVIELPEYDSNESRPNVTRYGPGTGTTDGETSAGSSSGVRVDGLVTPSRRIGPAPDDTTERTLREVEQSLEDHLFEGSGLEGDDRFSFRRDPPRSVPLSVAALDLSPATFDRPPGASRADLIRAYLGGVGLVDSPFAPEVFARAVLGPDDSLDAASFSDAVADSEGASTVLDSLAARPRGDWSYGLVVGTVSLLDEALTRHANEGSSALGRALAAVGDGQLVLDTGYATQGRQHATAEAGGYVTLPEVAAFVAGYNANRGSIPGSIAPLVDQVANDDVRVVIEGERGDDVWDVRLRDGRIVRYERGAAPSANVAVTTDWPTVAGVVDAADPLAAGVRAYDEGRVSVRGLGLVDGVRVGLLTTTYSVYRAVRGLLGGSA